MIIGAFITVIVVTIGGGLFFAYFGSSEPILYMSIPYFPSFSCYPNGFDINNGYTYTINLANKAETTASSKVCFYGENISFVTNDGKKNENVCYSEDKVPPKSSELVKIYNPKLFLKDNEKPDNFTIRIQSSCSYSILSFLSKKCQGIDQICKFKKQYSTSNYQNFD